MKCSLAKSLKIKEIMWEGGGIGLQGVLLCQQKNVRVMLVKRQVL
jgi:hypothetical protein